MSDLVELSRESKALALVRLKSESAQPDLAAELYSVCDDINFDGDIRAVIITGRDNTFCQGIPAQLNSRQFSLAAPVARLNCPVIAAINGDATGMGLELALACDIRMAADNARFSLPYIEAGLIPSDGATQRLPRLIGRAKAMELLLTGQVIDAAEAYRIGLVSKVLGHEELMPYVLQIGNEMAGKASLALKYCKEAVLKGLDMTLGQGLRLEGDLYFLLHTTEDRTEGITAFKEKRKPRFKGK